MKITVKEAAKAKLPAGKTDHIEWDEDIPGFGLRIREGGSKSLVFQYKLGEKHRRMNFGRLSAVNLDDLRKQVQKLRARVVLGHDPAAEKVENKAQATHTFEATIRDYLEWQRTRKRRNGTVGLKARSLQEVERHLLSYAKPLHKLRVGKISRADISNCLDTVEENSGPVAKNRVRSSLSGFFTWAMQKGKAEANPVSLTAKNEEGDGRSRVLSRDELRTIWNALPEDQYGDIIRLLALTGQRRDEIAGLRWSEVGDGAIELPLERTKNGRAHSVPLSPAAERIIEKQERRTNADGQQRDMIFGFGEGPFSGWSGSKEKLAERIAEQAGKAIEDWRLHDLRRTAATMMAEHLNVQPHIIEAILNHVGGHKAGVAGIYNRATYEKEKREALNSWALHLLNIVEGANVVPLPRSA